MPTQQYCTVRQMYRLRRLLIAPSSTFYPNFFFSDAAERISSELVSWWFCTKNCVSYEINITDFLNEILSKVLGHFKYFST